ncbi:hypothetical protein F4818DRAFT_427220 [Hypoxylon cercidicola]|nr:hypothetical protein F4818DRAFT_427220 [Hypoxylon cercidicola]
MLASSGACAFGVDVGDTTADSVPIGTEDAATVIRRAVRMFGSGNATSTATNGTSPGAGKLGAAGAFQCGVNPVTMVNWALYHVM